MKTGLATAVQRVRDAARTRWWPIVGVFTTIALAVVVRNSPGMIVVDNRFELIADPGGRLVKSFALWDWSRGLGDIREDVWPLPTLVSEFFDLVGVPIWLSIRLWHAACLVIAATGIVAVMRLFRPRIGPEHVLGGLLAALGPFSLTFLVPSNLYLMFALGPWLLVLVVRGVTESDGWKWAAWFALVIGAAGNPDLPGLTYSTVLFVPTLIYLVLETGATTLRKVVRWIGMAGLLTVAVSALMLTKTTLARRRLSARVAETESVSVSALTSSWSESVRGLGNWLSYFRVGGRLTKPQGAVYFDQELVVAATFVVPIFALVVFWRSRWRPRLLFVSMMLLSLVIMVGSFRADESPIAWLIGRAMGSSAAFGGFRNAYKAAGGLVVGGSVLAAVGYAELRQRGRQRSPKWVWALNTATIAVVLAASTPAWAGNLYHPDRTTRAVPDYWFDATDFLDQIPEDGRVLVVPAVSQAPYRWGTVGDDIFDGLLERPHAIATGVALLAPLGAEALESLTLAAQDPVSGPDEFASLARRLGITEVVIRNDLDWQDARVARPSRFDSLRSDQSMELVATFGDAGQNVVATGDDSASARRELTLPPVEIYRVRDSSGIAQVTEATAPLIVSGSARSWPGLVSAGLLPDGVPTLASGASTVEQLREAFDRGAEVAITDTPRRRVRALISFEPAVSHTLTADEDLDRAALSLYPASGSEAVAWFADAEDIVGTVTREVGSTAHRPSMAFDDDPDTAWSVPRILAGGSARLRVRFRTPHTLDDVVIRALTRQGIPTARSGWVSLSDGTVRPFSFDADGVARLDLGGLESDTFDVLLREFDQRAGRVGVADVQIGTLDLREFVQTPDDLMQRLELSDELEQAPVSFSFTRVRTPTWFESLDDRSVRADEERVIRRRFPVPGTRRFELIGTASSTALTEPSRIDEIVAAAGERRCIDIGVRVQADDMAARTALVRPRGDEFDIRSGRPFAVEGCEPIALTSGWHLLQGGDPGLVDRLSLLDVTRSVVESEPTSTANVGSVAPGRVVAGGSFDGSIVTLHTSYDPSWTMVTEDGQRIGSSPMDGVNGWFLPDEVGDRIEFVRRGERLVRGAALVSLFAVLLCVWLIVRTRRAVEPTPFGLDRSEPGDVIGPDWFESAASSGDTPHESVDDTVASVVDDGPSPATRRATATAVSLSVLGAVALVGWPGLVVALGSWFVIFGNTRAKRLVGHSVDAIPAALLSLAAVATLVQFPLGSDTLALRFAGDRRWAHELALMSFAFVAALVPLRWLSDRPHSRRGDIEVEPPDPRAAVGDQSTHNEETAPT